MYRFLHVLLFQFPTTMEVRWLIVLRTPESTKVCACHPNLNSPWAQRSSSLTSKNVEKKSIFWKGPKKNTYCPRGSQAQFHIGTTQPPTSAHQNTRLLSGCHLLLRAVGTKKSCFWTYFWPSLTVNRFQDTYRRNCGP